MHNYLINIGEIVEHKIINGEQEGEIEYCYTSNTFKSIMRTTSVDITIPDNYNSEELRNVLIISGLTHQSTSHILDCYRTCISATEPIPNPSLQAGQRYVSLNGIVLAGTFNSPKQQTPIKQTLWAKLKSFFSQTKQECRCHRHHTSFS